MFCLWIMVYIFPLMITLLHVFLYLQLCYNWHEATRKSLCPPTLALYNKRNYCNHVQVYFFVESMSPFPVFWPLCIFKTGRFGVMSIAGYSHSGYALIGVPVKSSVKTFSYIKVSGPFMCLCVCMKLRSSEIVSELPVWESLKFWVSDSYLACLWGYKYIDPLLNFMGLFTLHPAFRTFTI